MEISPKAILGLKASIQIIFQTSADGIRKSQRTVFYSLLKFSLSHLFHFFFETIFILILFTTPNCFPPVDLLNLIAAVLT